MAEISNSTKQKADKTDQADDPFLQPGQIKDASIPKHGTKRVSLEDFTRLGPIPPAREASPDDFYGLLVGDSDELRDEFGVGSCVICYPMESTQKGDLVAVRFIDDTFVMARMEHMPSAGAVALQGEVSAVIKLSAIKSHRPLLYAQKDIKSIDHIGGVSRSFGIE